MSFDKRAHLCNLCSYEDKTVLELPGGLDVKGSGVTAVTQVTALAWFQSLALKLQHVMDTANKI